MDPRTRPPDISPPRPPSIFIPRITLLPGMTPAWKQKLYSPSSSPPPPHTPTPEETAYHNNKIIFPTGNPEPHFNPVLPAVELVCKHLNKAYLGLQDSKDIIIPRTPTDYFIQSEYKNTERGPGIMNVLRRGMKRVGIGEAREEAEQEIEIEEADYTIPLDGDHREFARSLMLRMLGKGLGAMHKNRIQRVNDMINDCMLTSWDDVVGITLWNLSRTNPFAHQNPTTRYLDGLFRGFRKTWIQVCIVNQTQIDFGEAVCRYLWKSRDQVAKMNLEILQLHARTFFLTSHGFWLYGYRLYRENLGYPLGVHCEHTLMDREKAPKMLIDYTLLLMNNEHFDSPDENIDLPLEIIDAAGSCIKSLTQEYIKQESNIHNQNLIDHFARNIFSASRQKLINYCRLSAQSLAFDEVV
ncbi:hypothetical protein TWF730_006981 [Orbilia blumenaviensis]|uniref:Uncharacterized protein n=1 Tax=Orbilia blumenaviensis TaxID=1796055 RepID=A0AAV9VM52_9PEZI